MRQKLLCVEVVGWDMGLSLGRGVETGDDASHAEAQGASCRVWCVPVNPLTISACGLCVRRALATWYSLASKPGGSSLPVTGPAEDME